MSGRSQRVRVDGCFSEWIEVISSVMQGSVLGGTLFKIYIDDIDDAASGATINKFADDTKLAMVIETNEDAERLQRILNRICDWAKDWEMSFNIKKCKVIHYGNGNIENEYYMNEMRLEKATEEKDLGVWINNTMKTFSYIIVCILVKTLKFSVSSTVY